MSISENEVPAHLLSFLNGMGMSLGSVESLRYHEHKEEVKQLLKSRGSETYDDKTWFIVVKVLDRRDGVIKLFDVVCDAKTGECRMLPSL